MLTVYGRATSSNVQAVMWLVAELGLTHKRIDKGHVYGGLDDPEYRAINPHGVVPALEDGDVKMFESAAINRYLAAEYGRGTPFWRESPRERAPIDAWAEWAKVSLSPAFTVPIFWAAVRTPEEKRNPAAIAAAVRNFEGLLLRVGAQLGDKKYLMGDELTLADIAVGHLLYRYFDIDVERQDRPRVRAYYDRLTEREAYAKHVMVSYDPLRA